MGRISQQSAKDLAKAVLDEKRKKLKTQAVTLSELAYILAAKTIPKDVLELFPKHQKYFNETNRVYITGNGFNRQRFDFPTALPLSSDYLTLPVDDSNILLDAFDAFDDAEKAYEQLYTELYSAFIGLGSYKLIREAFPEAARFIPDSVSNTALAINVSDLRKKIAA